MLSEDFSGDINGVTMTCAGTSGSVGGNFDLDVPYNTELGTPCALFGIETPTEASLVGYLGSLIDGGSSQNSVAYFDNGNDAGLIATGAYFEAIAEPEPPSLAILLIGIAVLTFGFRRKNRSLLGC